MTARIELQAAWDAHAGLVIGTAYKFFRRYGGDLEEIKADAMSHFVDAAISYEESNSPQRYWIRSKVWLCLLEDRERRARRHKHETAARRRDDGYRPRSNADWQDELGPDAREVVDAVINPPPDVQCMLADDRRKLKSKEVLARFFRQCGWRNKRIRKAFLGIEKAIA